MRRCSALCGAMISILLAWSKGVHALLQTQEVLEYICAVEDHKLVRDADQEFSQVGQLNPVNRCQQRCTKILGFRYLSLSIQ